MSQFNEQTLPVTAEEDIEFDLLDKRLAPADLASDRAEQLKRMVAIAGECRTTSLTGICTALLNAGCHFYK